MAGAARVRFGVAAARALSASLAAALAAFLAASLSVLGFLTLTRVAALAFLSAATRGDPLRDCRLWRKLGSQRENRCGLGDPQRQNQTQHHAPRF
jgi:hypothetical protein